MKIIRQPLINRVVHWGIALSCFGLIFTGILQMPVAKRYGLTALGEWMGNYFTTLSLHYFFGLIFAFFCCFHVFFHALNKEFDIVPKKGDVKGSILIFKAILSGEKEPPSAKYLPEQRLAWAAFAVTFLILIVTGLLKTYKNFPGVQLEDPWIFYIAQFHNLGFVLCILLFVGHMAAFVIKANRNLLPAMFSGKVDREYALERHSLWSPD